MGRWVSGELFGENRRRRGRGRRGGRHKGEGGGIACALYVEGDVKKCQYGYEFDRGECR